MAKNSYPKWQIGTRFVLPIDVSFETNEQWTDLDLPALPVRFSLVGVSGVVTKAIAGSNNATVTVKKSSTTLATMTFNASDAIGQARSAPSVTETAFGTSDKLRLTTSKATAGGKGVVFLTLEVLPSHA